MSRFSLFGRKEEAPAPERKSWLGRLADGLRKSTEALTGNVAAVFTKKKLDAETLEALEERLIAADLGLETSAAIVGRLRAERYDREISDKELREVMAGEIEKTLAPVALPLAIDRAQKPFVILVAGVNGTGKTTTIGKLAARLSAEGMTVMLAAGDTFRAAAIEQLKIWGERTGSDVIAREPGSDASGLVHDAATRAKEAGADVLIVDTAGRLQNREELMGELEKIIRVIGKAIPGAPHARLLVLDATTGQNALLQAEIFGKKAGITGLVMTKLDGTARGGILVAIAGKYRLPVHFIGVGEAVEDLAPFSAHEFAAAIAGIGESA